jgi:hypothetical protein
MIQAQQDQFHFLVQTDIPTNVVFHNHRTLQTSATDALKTEERGQVL